MSAKRPATFTSFRDIRSSLLYSSLNPRTRESIKAIGGYNRLMSLKRRIHEFLGGSKMAALPAGSKAPAFALQSTDGKRLNLADALKKGPVVAAFFKASCPTCQFTAPFLERLGSDSREAGCSRPGNRRIGRSGGFPANIITSVTVI